jgi:hypothetical protein
MLPKNFKISSFLPPTIFTVGGENYACPGWHIIPEGTTLSEVRERWTQELPKTEKKPTHLIHEVIDSSTGNGKTYNVTFDGIYWACTCPGFEFRRNCRHLKEVKAKHNIKEVQYK